MIAKLLNRKRGRRAAESTPTSGPAGARAYAIGDVHGRLDLLEELIERIARDRAADPIERDFTVFLGDLVDRGPDSAGVVDFLLAQRELLPSPVFLMGNHEEMFLQVLTGEHSCLWDWLSFGGYECAQSYGVEVGKLAALDAAEAAALIRAAVPSEHLAFLASFADSFQFGDYLFVHAGIRPGVPLELQSKHDLRWIREDFLGSAAHHPFVVVHGHTIAPEPEELPRRIGIDTGAYASGVLTALELEGTGRRFVQAIKAC